MILGVNGIRLVSARSGVARMIEAVLWCLDEMDHPFRSIRVYSPSPIPAEVKLPPAPQAWSFRVGSVLRFGSSSTCHARTDAMACSSVRPT